MGDLRSYCIVGDIASSDVHTFSIHDNSVRPCGIPYKSCDLFAIPCCWVYYAKIHKLRKYAKISKFCKKMLTTHFYAKIQKKPQG